MPYSASKIPSRKKPLLDKEAIARLTQVTHAGIDEAGRGCLAGPVVAAVVLIPPMVEKILPLLADSKVLSEKKRDHLAPLIMQHCHYALGLSWPAEIDEVNIVNANFRAMGRALTLLMRQMHTDSLPPIYIDGNLTLRESEWDAVNTISPTHWHDSTFPFIERLRHRQSSPELSLPFQKKAFPSTCLPESKGHHAKHENFPFSSQQAIIKGDALIPAISAASILAKTRRDFIMRKLDAYFPHYGFAKHKGYGTKEHYAALARYGACPLHRTTFITQAITKEIPLSLF